MIIVKNTILAAITLVFFINTMKNAAPDVGIPMNAKSIPDGFDASQPAEEEIIFGDSPDSIIAYLGTTPVLDGFIRAGEYDDADKIVGVRGWKSDTPPAAEQSEDLSAVGWVKHDGSSLYFAFDVTDDVIYGFDIERWVPDNNPDANKLNWQRGWPFWGDGIELMMNSTYQWDDDSRCIGDGRSWQFCCSTNKSILGGLGVGGLSSGLPLTSDVWARYEHWIRSGSMEASVRLKSKEEGRGYVFEWRINPNPCMKIDETTFVDLSKETKVGFNIEFQDLDEKEKGEGNFSNMHHIDYWSRVDSRAPLITLFGMIAPYFFSDTRRQKRSLAGLNEHFGNEVAGEKNKLATKVGFLEVPSNRKTDLRSFGTLIIKPIKRQAYEARSKMAKRRY